MTLRFFLLYILCIQLIACGDNTADVSSNTAQQQDVVPAIVEVIEPEVNSDEGVVFDPTAYEIKNGHVVLSWADLAKVDFKMQYNEEMESEVPYPIFSETIKALAGKPVMIEGYVIPVEETGDNSIIILSAFPYTQCFFCGAAGPESVMDILAKGKLSKLKMDDEVTFKGKLKLNDSDLDYLNYILEEAELISE